MLKEVKFLEELGLWLAVFGDVNLLYDDIIRDIHLKPKEITEGVILLRNLGIQNIYNFHTASYFGEPYHSNMNTTKNFFLYRMLDSEIILVYNKPAIIAFEENGKTVYKPDKVRYYVYRKTEIYHIYPRNVYHVYYEGIKLITSTNEEIIINQARPLQ
jgi:hypothetical protein